MRSGQDSIAGTRYDAPAWHNLDSEESGRSTVQVKLRLQPDVALNLRVQADRDGRAVSEYVARLLIGAAVANTAVGADGNDERMEALAIVKEYSRALQGCALELGSSRSRMGSSYGLVKNLFNEAPIDAEKHNVALHAIIVEMRDTNARADEAIEKMSDLLRAMNPAIEAAKKRLDVLR